MTRKSKTTLDRNGWNCRELDRCEEHTEKEASAADEEGSR